MRRSQYPVILLLLTVFTVFIPVRGLDFLSYDDNVNIYNNALVSHPGGKSFYQFWVAPHEGLYIPLTYSLWALLAKVSALFPSSVGSVPTLNPQVYHFVDLLLHMLSTLVLFRILRLLLDNDWYAAAGSLLFAIHPVQVESVAWATGMKDLLSGHFVLLALWQYLLLTESKGTSPVKKSLSSGLLIVCYFAALLAKPGAVAFPLVAGIFGYVLLRRSLSQLVPRLLPLLLLALPVVLVTQFAQSGGEQELVPALWQRFFLGGDAMLFYLGKLFLPLELGPDYGRTPDHVLSQGWTYVLALVPYLLVCIGWWKIREPYFRAAMGIFVAFLLLVLGFTPFTFQAISTVADRYLYLALLGPTLCVGWLLRRYIGKQVWIGTAIAILLMAGQSMATIAHWKDSKPLAAHALQVNPRSWVAHNIFAAASIERHLHPAAASVVEKAIAANRGYGIAYVNLGVPLQNLKRHEEAIAAYQNALKLRPAFLPII